MPFRPYGFHNRERISLPRPPAVGSEEDIFPSTGRGFMLGKMVTVLSSPDPAAYRALIPPHQ